MFFLAGAAASSALDLMSTLQQTLTPQMSGTPAVQAFDPAAGAGPSATSASASAAAPSAPVAPGTMNALLSVQGQPGLVNGDAFSTQLFSLLDRDSDGTISKSEFEATFGRNGKTAQADSIFSRLDANSDGSVDPSELASALQNASEAHRDHHGHHHGGGVGETSASGGASGGTGSTPGSSDPLTQSDTSQTVTNADGSTTTTITYGDGSQVSMTTPATASDTNLHHFLERLIQRQAQMLATSSPGQALAMSV